MSNPTAKSSAGNGFLTKIGTFLPARPAVVWFRIWSMSSEQAQLPAPLVASTALFVLPRPKGRKGVGIIIQDLQHC